LYIEAFVLRIVFNKLDMHRNTLSFKCDRNVFIYSILMAALLHF